MISLCCHSMLGSSILFLFAGLGFNGRIYPLPYQQVGSLLSDALLSEVKMLKVIIILAYCGDGT